MHADEAGPHCVRSVFDRTVAGTIGLEEEILLVRRDSWLPAPAAAVVADIGDPRVKQELPSCQVEIATSVHTSAVDAVGELRWGRARIAAACSADVVPIAAAVHPLADLPVALAPTDRADGLKARYGERIGRQLVSSLQIHLAFGDADCTLGVYHALRDLLPELAALAGAAPFAAGRDTGLCSVRPIIACELPRQGVPPIIASWTEFAEDLEWAVQGVSRSGGGSCDRTSGTERWSCACSTYRRRRSGPRRSSGSCPRSPPGSPTCTAAANCPLRRRRGGSRRTDGPRCGTASAASCSTSAPARHAPPADASTTSSTPRSPTHQAIWTPYGHWLPTRP
ncbi:glutamate-cysteine ligase family protein [Kribbella sp. NPDC051936]|uniref:glutamate-cysteine ligase family protein n=1 Tax=Kribbella sp. NPDC051936 TaxID=3154946 RepID=UPI00343E6946